MYQLSVLPCGLKVATATMPAMHSSALGIYVGVGSRHESVSEGGMSHFLEHMLFKGTNRRTVRDIPREVEGSGGSLNAYTTEEYTCYEVRGPAKRLPVMADIVADMVLNPAFPPDELERERDVILEEITMYRENPSDFVHELAAEVLWGGHPLGRPITGTQASLKKMDRSSLADFHARHYMTPAHVLAVAGPHTHEEIREMASKLYEGRPLSGSLPSSPEFSRNQYPSPGVLEDHRAIEQTHFVLGYEGPGYQSEDRFALRLLSVILGESMSSRLFQEIREKRGLAYSIYSDLSLHRECGGLTIYAGVDGEKKEIALDTIRAEVAALLAGGCTEKELEQARCYLLGQMTVQLDSTMGQLGWIGESSLQRGSIIPPEVTRARFEAVTVDDISKAAQLLFQDKTGAVAVVGS